MWRRQLEHVLDARHDLVDGFRAQRPGHALLRPVDVDRHGQGGAAHVFEQERRPAALRRAVGDLGDLEIRVDGLADAHDLAALLEEGEELPEILESWRHGLPARTDRVPWARAAV
jgi:hypothetical protein